MRFECPPSPPVSCLCLTYGRPYALEEAIESFLRQDYSGPKELLVLNDLAEQELVCNEPQVRVINVPVRFRTVGEKRNASAALAAHDILFVWDDDDVFLPHRISYCVEKLRVTGRPFYKPSLAWILNGDTLLGPERNLFHSGACFTRELFNAAHGYAHIGSGQDINFELAVIPLLQGEKNDDRILPPEIYYIYRWNGTGSYHLSHFGPDQKERPSGNAQVADFVRREIQAGRVPTGTITLQPHWSRNYVECVKESLSRLSDG